MERHFTHEHIYVENKHIKRCLTSLAFSEMQIKTTVKYHYTHIKMAFFFLMAISKAGEKLDHLYTASSNDKWYKHSINLFASVLKIKLVTHHMTQ